MKSALVLCGGGAKGSYQMGVWKLLNEIGYEFDIVCGTSIGALNGAMYVQDDYERSNELWDKISLDLIMKEDIQYDEKVGILKMLKEHSDLINIVQRFFINKGADITPFKKLMDEYIDASKIKKSKVIFGIVSASFPTLTPLEIVINDLSLEDINNYILASVSCFPIFPICKINDASFIDGGYYDNLPINFAISLGADEIIAVDLNYSITHEEFLNKPYVKYIKPSWPLGGFMIFERSQIEPNRVLGYNDASKCFGLKLGFRYTFNLVNGFDEVSHRFIMFIANINGRMKAKKIKTNVKPESAGNIFYLLEKETYRPLSNLEYYIRAIEIAAEFFRINHLVIYDLNTMINLIIENVMEISDNEDLFNSYESLKPNKQRDFISRVNDNDLVKYLYNYAHWDETIPSDFLVNILASKPIPFLIYVICKMRNELL